MPSMRRLAKCGFFLTCLLLTISCSRPLSLDSEVETCPQQVPNPPEVTSFYEDDPTYVDPDVSPTNFETTTPESQGMISQRLASGAALLETVPQALSLLVIRNGKLVFERYFHGSQSNHANNIHSASKTLLSGLIGIALEEGFIESIDEKISDILPQDLNFNEKAKSLTVKHLLTMSAGFDWKEDQSESLIENEENWLQAILNLPILQTPGTAFNYNTGLTHLLSAVLTESSEMDTCNFGSKYFFRPMGISIKHWGRDPQGYYSGGYNLYLTALDLAKVAQMYLQKGEWDGKVVVPSHWIQEATQPKIQSEHPQYTYGYLWWLFTAGGHAIYKMWGYGGQYAYLVPDLNLVMVTTADTKEVYPEFDADNFLLNQIIGAVTPLVPATNR